MRKTILPTVMVLALSSLSTLAQDDVSKARQSKSQKISQYYAQAEQAYADGDVEAAKSALRNVFALDRRHGPSTALALKLRGSGTEFKVKARERQFAAVIVPTVEFDQMPLSDALRNLSKLVEETSKDKVIPNFVIHDSSNTLKDKLVTLNMKQVPANVVLEYLMNLSNATAKFGQYAIEIKPRSVRNAPAPKKVESEFE
ncbi:hypothetical protein [Rubritalea tangerina]|uniref:Uncharacterized protein n=1 Tax=Rubritalea tangerina TaxID=430798 RepID=A0ABW4ZF51_9BACT